MARWGKTQSTPQAAASDEFWAWWSAEGAAAVATALNERSGGPAIVGLLAERIAAIRPGLAWELGPGVDGSAHMLTVTAEGNPDLRAASRRWLRAAPAADATWCFTDAKQASPAAALDLQGHRLTAAETTMTAAINDSSRTVNVQLFHPAFAMAGQEFADLAGFLLLDLLLGEAAVETWVAAVEPSTTPLPNAVPLTDLPELVGRVSRPPEHPDPSGDNISWQLVQGTDPAGRPLIATLSVPLRPMISPTLDTYVGITVAYGEQNDRQWPVGASYQNLLALENDLTMLVAGSGRVVAHQTSAGSPTLHFYVDGATPAAEQLRAGLGGWKESKPQVEVRLDPAWDAVRHLRG